MIANRRSKYTSKSGSYPLQKLVKICLINITKLIKTSTTQEVTSKFLTDTKIPHVRLQLVQKIIQRKINPKLS
jgi:hypothetical protein